MSRGQGPPTSIEMANVPVETYRVIFDKLDRDGDGKIQLNEFESARKRFEKEVPDSIGPSLWKKLLIKADADRDASLDFPEFLDLMRSPDMPMPARLWLTSNVKTFTKNYTRAVVPPRVHETLVVDAVGDYDKEYNCMPPPIALFTISLIEIAVFIYYAVTLGDVSPTTPVPIDSPLIYNPYRRYEGWRYFTYMLIHAGYAHLISNLLVQLLLGIPLELVHKWWRISIIYMCGVIAGSLATSVCDPTAWLAGASGGVYAIITAHLANLIMNWKEMRYAAFQLGALTIIIGVDVAVSFYDRYVNWNEDVRIGYAAHFAGAIAGLLVGIGVLKNLKKRSWEKKLWWGSVGLFSLLMLGAIIWNIAFPSYFRQLQKTPTIEDYS